MPARLLIVEDNPDLLAILQQLLSEDFEVVTTHTGEDALVLARERRPDAVILDLQLPGMDGIETGRLLKQEAAPASLPILALTALGPGHADTMLASGCCDAYLAKPATLTDIRATIQQLLEHRQAA